MFHTPIAQARLNTQQEKFKELLKIAQKINNVSYFVQALSKKSGFSTTEHTVEIKRTSLLDPAKVSTLKSDPIRVGRPRFSISAGLGYHGIRQKTVARQSGLVPKIGTDGKPELNDDDTPIMELGQVFAYSENSNKSVVGALQLNASLHRFKGSPWDFGASVGFTLGQGDDDTQLGYLSGIHFSTLDNQLFLTLGYYLERVEMLSSDFEIGDPVPKDLNDPLPTTKKTDGSLIFSISYKFK